MGSTTVFNIPVTGPIGNASEATLNYEFASKLDMQAKAKSVGNVTTVQTASGVFEVILTLSATGEQSSYGAPAANAFGQLNEYLSTSLAEKSATWKAKVNGTTIITGTY